MNIKKLMSFLLALCLAASPVYAQPQETEEIVPETISLNFKDTDIRVVLQALSEKGQVNIVPAPEVTGTVSIKLKDVDWETALEVLLRTYDYGYAKFNDIVMVAPLEKIQEREAQEKAREAVEPAQMRIFELEFLDASDALVAIRPMLSAAGKISVLQSTGQAGWAFGEEDEATVSKRERVASGTVSKSKKLIVTDIVKRLDAVEKLLDKIDIRPQQILIQARIMEVDHNDLEDIGVQWATGSDGVSDGGSLQSTGRNLGSDRGAFSTSILSAGTEAATAAIGGNTVGESDGLEFLYQKLGGSEFEVLINTLEEKVSSNLLSSPSLLTLNNQEATIVVGEKYPIIETIIDEDNGNVTGGSLDKYEEIGVQLNVVPQLSGDGQFINMIVHPAVTSISGFVTVNSSTQVADSKPVPIISYPRIDTREAETQIIVRNGETVVIGGLIKDTESKSVAGVPLLKDIPFIGRLFRRDITSVQKLELLIFLTAKIVEPGEIISSQLTNKYRVKAAFASDFPEEGTYIEVVKDDDMKEEGIAEETVETEAVIEEETSEEIIVE